MVWFQKLWAEPQCNTTSKAGWGLGEYLQLEKVFKDLHWSCVCITSTLFLQGFVFIWDSPWKRGIKTGITEELKFSKPPLGLSLYAMPSCCWAGTGVHCKVYITIKWQYISGIAVYLIDSQVAFDLVMTLLSELRPLGLSWPGPCLLFPLLFHSCLPDLSDGRL